MKQAEKLLRRMRQSKSGWGQVDFAKLYIGFGFEATEGKKHTIYIHPEYPNLRASVGRHNNLATGYAETAINLIDQLKKLQAAREDESDAN